MSTRKKLEALDVETQYSFDNVKRDILFLFDLIEQANRENARQNAGLARQVKRLIREVSKNHRHGVLSGNTYPTLAGKVKAIAENLGIEFGVEPRVVTPTKVTATKKAVTKKVAKK